MVKLKAEEVVAIIVEEDFEVVEVTVEDITIHIKCLKPTRITSHT